MVATVELNNISLIGTNQTDFISSVYWVGFWVRSEGYAERNLNTGTGDRLFPYKLANLNADKRYHEFRFGRSRKLNYLIPI
jgi:hypothetical protein